VKPGDRQVLSVKTRADAAVAYVTQYSDDDSHGENGGGASDSDGKFSDEFVVDPDAPDGVATVTVTSQKDGVSFAQVKFTVNC
jgi:hypothetical protein